MSYIDCKDKDELKHELLNTNNTSYFRESFWKNNLHVFYDEILTWHFPEEFKFTQKIYHYLNDDPELKLGICPECGNRCLFINTNKGYHKYCSKQCSNNSKEVRDKYAKTCLKHYGKTNPFLDKDIIEHSKQKRTETYLARYGVDHPAKLKCNIEKAKETCRERYGKDSYTQTVEYQEKSKLTRLNRYNDENYNNREKAKETCLEKYGKENYSQTEEFKERFSDVEFIEHLKTINREKYGVDWYFQSDEFKNKFKDIEFVKNIQDKIKATNLEKFGVDWYFQTDRCREKLQEKFNDAKFIEQLKQINQEKYCTDWYFQSDEFKNKFKNYEWVKSTQEKIYNTKKKNNTFNTSKIENQLKLYLDSLGVNYVYQHTSDRYPFNCDFYFPDFDLYVEIQGSWTHGGRPFENTEEDLLLLEKWNSKGTKYYKNAIKTWTVRDVNKREIAKQNQLNYLEIFSCNFETVIEKLKNYI